MSRLELPGNPRYQPKDLRELFGYDNLARALVEVELATLRALADLGAIGSEDIALLTPEVTARLLSITTTEVDRVEREVTKHDIRALVRLMQEAMPESLRRWVHVPLTSYDVIDTARTLLFLRVHRNVVAPKTKQVIKCLWQQVLLHAETPQIGRTHGQHALPVTVGFWLATILSRVFFNHREMERYADGLVGKISGPVGAYNAQASLGITGPDCAFERRVLELLDLEPAPISTQILPPEPLAYYLWSCLALSASFGQFGRDARHLMRTEIAELREPFEAGQVGSSTMAHKRNPITFENLEGTWLKNQTEFFKILATMISEHQRDLVGSCVSRDFPTLVVNLVSQLDALLRPGKDGVPFLARLAVDTDACERNLRLSGDVVLAEPFYLALQMHGYAGDAHEIINHRAMPMVGVSASALYEAVEAIAKQNPAVGAAWFMVPQDLKRMLRTPQSYVGFASAKSMQVWNAVADHFGWD